MKWLFLFLSGCFILGSCTLVKKSIFNPIYYHKKVSYEFYCSVPYELKNGAIILKLNINGAICNFYFDSGSKSYIKSETRKKLDLQHHFYSTSRDANLVTNQSEIVLCNLELGNVRLNNFKLHVTNSTIFDCTNSIDGILGNDILNQGVFYFDTENKKLIISSSIDKITGLDGFEKIRIKKHFGDILIKNYGIRFVLDSGYSNGFILTNTKSDFYEEGKEKKTFLSTINGLNSTQIYKSIYQNGNLNVVGNQYMGIIQFTDELNLNLLGSKFFQMNSIVFDWKKNKLYIKKVPSDGINRINNLINIHFTLLNGDVRISRLTNEMEGICLFDQVLQINNFDLQEFHSDCELQEFLSTLNKDVGLDLIVKKENETTKIYLSKEELFKTN